MRVRRVYKALTPLIIKEAYNLIMLGYTPLMVKSALDLTDVEWGVINQSKIYHQLIIQKDIKESGVECNAQRLKGVELTLFTAIERYHKAGIRSEYRAKLGTQIDHLKKEYASFNIFN